MEVFKLSIPKIADKLRKKDISAAELSSLYMERVKKLKGLNAYISVLEEAALNSARKIDEVGIKNSDPLLKGIPVALKDNIMAKGVKNTCGSKMLKDYVAPYSSTVAEKLERAGSILLGKTNMDEFAMGSSNETSYFGPVKNPWSMAHVPGGSSGGSAVAVASAQTQIAYGTDTGGSVRLPASFNACLALKPSYGRISRYGIVAFASSLDQVGPMARNVEDLAIAYDVVSGKDPKDSSNSSARPSGSYEHLTSSVIGKEKNIKKKIGVPWDIMKEGVNPEVLNAFNNSLQLFKDKGFELVDVKLPNSKYALDVYYIVATAEASSNLARFDGIRYGYRADEYANLDELYSKTRDEGFGEEVKRRIMLGTFVLSAGYYDAYFAKAAKVRNLIRKDFEEAFKCCDIIMLPTSPVTAFKIGEKISDPLTMYLSDVFTISVNLAALPAMSVPAGFDKRGLPIGLQMIGKRFDENSLFETAWLLQEQKPDLFNRIADPSAGEIK
jgi:aspartyl-tRNA(Asn)/glutamyl-tRNA(Gln) amidotransferase subunit A